MQIVAIYWKNKKYIRMQFITSRMKQRLLMKRFFSLLLPLFFIHTNFAQTVSDINWLHYSDLVVGRQVVRMGVKEIYRSKELTYYFECRMDGTTDSFQIPASDFVKGEYLEKLFLTRLKSAYDHLNQPVPVGVPLEKKVDQSAQKVDSNTPLSVANRMEIQETLQALGDGNYDNTKINSLVDRIKSKTTNNDDQTWLAEKIVELNTVRREKQTNEEKALETNGRIFLNNVLDILQKRTQEGSKVGVVYVYDQAPIYWYNDKEPGKLPLKDSVLTIREVQIKFESGQIAGIAIKGYLDDFGNKVLTFHNRVPISFSTKFDVSQDYYIVRNIEIYCKDNILDGYHVDLDEVIYNDYQLSNYTNNYSPIDTVILLKPFEVGRVIFRERATDILQARVYSDFIGYGGDQPNGLVQVEFSKTINLKTSIRKSGVEKKPVRKGLIPQDSTTSATTYSFFDISSRQDTKRKKTPDADSWQWLKASRYKKIHTYEWFRYTIPLVALTKIEKDDKYLEVALDADSTGFVTAIDLMKYSNFKAGLQHNILKASRPEFHSSFTWDASFYMMLTGINNRYTTRDSAVSGATFFTNRSSQTNALFFSMSPLVLAWNIYPHNIYHVSVTGALQYVAETNKDFNFLEKERRLGQWIYHLGLFAGVKTTESGNGQFFVRVLLDMNAVYMDQRYYQAQVGYAVKVFSRKSEFKNRPVFN